MRIIVTTSNKYLHLIPVFTYLFNKYWSKDQEVTIVGYNPPKCELPSNFKFHSMGEQGAVNEWSTDLRRYFEQLPDTHFIWLMEDTFIKSANKEVIDIMYRWVDTGASIWPCTIGRIDLTNDIQKRGHKVNGGFIESDSYSRYRLSTQPSIWSRKFLLQYLTDGQDPWTFETQDPKSDGWDVIGLENAPLTHNEGVRKFDPHKLDLNGFDEIDIKHINSLL